MSMETVIYTIVTAFNLFVSTGQIIVKYGFYLTMFAINIVTKTLLVLKIIVEDFAIFAIDFYHKICLIHDVLCNISNTISFAVVYVYKNWLDLLTSSKNILLETITTIYNLIGGSIGILHAAVISIGDGTWFVVVFLPKSFANYLPILYNFLKTFTVELCDYCLAFIYFLSQKLFILYKITTRSVLDIRIESLAGIVLATMLTYYLYNTCASVYIKLANFYNITLNKANLLITAIYNRVRNILQRRHRIENPRNATGPPAAKRNSRTVSHNQKSVENDLSCVICQDRMRSVLLLPCRHLCLCTECSYEIRHYQNSCPVCRNRIQSNMQVFV